MYDVSRVVPFGVVNLYPSFVCTVLFLDVSTKKAIAVENF